MGDSGFWRDLMGYTFYFWGDLIGFNWSWWTHISLWKSPYYLTVGITMSYINHPFSWEWWVNIPTMVMWWLGDGFWDDDIPNIWTNKSHVPNQQLTHWPLILLQALGHMTIKTKQFLLVPWTSSPFCEAKWLSRASAAADCGIALWPMTQTPSTSSRA